jgi:exodeoxyribonuclease VII small subunit
VTMAKVESEPASGPNPIVNFEAGLKELEGVVKEMETADLPLERSLELFEKGMQLSEVCRKQLMEAETRVEILMKKEGKYQAEPFRPSK